MKIVNDNWKVNAMLQIIHWFEPHKQIKKTPNQNSISQGILICGTKCTLTPHTGQGVRVETVAHPTGQFAHFVKHFVGPVQVLQVKKMKKRGITHSFTQPEAHSTLHRLSVCGCSYVNKLQARAYRFNDLKLGLRNLDFSTHFRPLYISAVRMTLRRTATN